MIHSGSGQMRMMVLPAAVTAFALLSLSGCSEPQKVVSFKAGGMTHSFAEGNDSVPKDFPLPVYPGATATGSISAEGQGDEQSKFSMLSSKDDIHKVSDYYQQELKGKGWTVDDVQPSDNLISITAHSKDLQANVMLSADEDKQTTISLSVSKSSDATTSADDAEAATENFTPQKTAPVPTD